MIGGGRRSRGQDVKDGKMLLNPRLIKYLEKQGLGNPIATSTDSVRPSIGMHPDAVFEGNEP